MKPSRGRIRNLASITLCALVSTSCLDDDPLSVEQPDSPDFPTVQHGVVIGDWTYVTYTRTSLGVSLEGVAISPDGRWVVGKWTNPNSSAYVFRMDRQNSAAGKFSLFGQSESWMDARATDVNSDGWVVLNYEDGEADELVAAVFRVDASAPAPLPVPPGLGEPTVLAISEGPNPIAVGWAYQGEDQVPLRWDLTADNATVTVLPTGGSQHVATDVNKAAGYIVGYNEDDEVVRWRLTNHARVAFKPAFPFLVGAVDGSFDFKSVHVSAGKRIAGGADVISCTASGNCFTRTHGFTSTVGFTNVDLYGYYAVAISDQNLTAGNTSSTFPHLRKDGQDLGVFIDAPGTIRDIGTNLLWSDGSVLRVYTFGLLNDADDDGLSDVEDNCPTVPNGQTDSDADGYGDECDYAVSLDAAAVNTTTRPEGTAFRFTSSASSEGRLSYLWEFSDGATSNRPNVAHAFADDGVFSATLTVSSGGDTKTMTFNNLTVTNARPLVTITPSTTTPVVGVPFSLGITITDRGLNDALSYTIRWGDQTIETFDCPSNPCSVMKEHTYTRARSRTLAVDASDDDGGLRRARVALTVTK